MKKIIVMLMLSVFLLFAKEPFAIPITFDAKGFSISDIFLYPEDITTGLSSIFYTINIDKEEVISITSNFPDFPGCPHVKTIDDYLNYKEFVEKNSKDEKRVILCKEIENRAFYTKKRKKYNQNDLTIFSLEYSNDEKNKDNMYFILTVFYQDKFISNLIYSFKNNLKENKDVVDSLARSIRLNENIKDIDYYIKQANKYLEASLLNKAYENIFSALLIDSRNEEVRLLHTKLLKNEVKK